ncbi:hypothetical protein [Allosphingosinicella indica]|uniref:DUF429 domain-containing protein n=1 Tax=Allosphingosinicella indica TaxID=941907 RepID=A0A1X7GH85_9SPHN|nr:hypothetical protein [Allosphingosinicella indica]SMF69832.1 hypothetical protein SAMN06295910_1775 [Allosphingosinicella indica]
MTRFARFAAIDWSGAKGRKHKGIAVACADAGGGAPYLVEADGVWSRQAVLDWLLSAAEATPTLFGFDFSFAPPILRRGAYLPGEPGVPDEAKAFWAYVDHRAADDIDLGAASFLEEHHRPHFYFGAADGPKAAFLHHRACEDAFNATGGGKASTLYDAIGAAQVAKASFAGMRLLHRLDGRVPVWPFDPLPSGGSVVVEIYTRVFIRLAGLSGRKVRTEPDLAAALAALGSTSPILSTPPNDHQTDVLIAAAGLRAIAGDPKYWSPSGLTPKIARTEGWTFGVA